MGHPKLKAIREEPSENLGKCVESAREGNQEAQGRLIRETQDRLYRFCYFLCGDPNLANDLCQDSYVYALENLSKLRDPDAFRGWLFTVARHKFIDYRRSPRNQPYDPVDSPKLPASLTNDEDRTLTIQIHKTLSRLTDEDREAILLIDLEQNSYEEAAKMIGISENALRSRLHRARKAFASAFDQP